MPEAGFGMSGMLGGCEAVTDAPEPGLNSPTATAGFIAPAISSADKLYAPELTACQIHRFEYRCEVEV